MSGPIARTCHLSIQYTTMPLAKSGKAAVTEFPKGSGWGATLISDALLDPGQSLSVHFRPPHR